MIPSHNRRFAAHAERADEAVTIDDRNFLIVTFVLRPSRNVVDAAIGVVRVNRELLLVLTRQNPVIGVHADFRDDGVFLFAPRHSGGDPASDDLVFVAAGVHLATAAVRGLAGRFEQE